MKAVTNILHNGELIEAGQPVKGIEGKELEALKVSGSVVEDKQYDALNGEDRQAEIAKLQARLVELGVDQSVSPAPPTPGDAAQQLDREAAIKAYTDKGKSHDEAVKLVDEDIKKAAAKSANN